MQIHCATLSFHSMAYKYNLLCNSFNRIKIKEHSIWMKRLCTCMTRWYCYELRVVRHCGRCQCVVWRLYKTYLRTYTNILTNKKNNHKVSQAIYIVMASFHILLEKRNLKNLRVFSLFLLEHNFLGWLFMLLFFFLNSFPRHQKSNAKLESLVWV